MPYSDPVKAREAKRKSAARRRGVDPGEKVDPGVDPMRHLMRRMREDDFRNRKIRDQFVKDHQPDLM